MHVIAKTLKCIKLHLQILVMEWVKEEHSYIYLFLYSNSVYINVYKNAINFLKLLFSLELKEDISAL